MALEDRVMALERQVESLLQMVAGSGIRGGSALGLKTTIAGDDGTNGHLGQVFRVVEGRLCLNVGENGAYAVNDLNVPKPIGMAPGVDEFVSKVDHE